MEVFSRSFPVTSEEKPLWLCPLGDIQYDGPNGGTTEGRLQAHIAKGITRNALFIGGGDYIDFASPSNRQRLQQAALYDTARKVIEDKAHDLNRELFSRFLTPTIGRWLGLLHGHHYYEYQDGTTSDQELSDWLEARFLGTSAMIRLVFNDKRRGLRGAVNLWAHHGNGSGNACAPIRKLESMAAYWQADIMLISHMTKIAAAPIQRVRPVFSSLDGEGDLLHQDIMLVGTGGFSKGYVVGSKQGRVPMGSYVEQGMMKPVALRAPLISITPHWKHKAGRMRFTPTINVEV